MGASITHSGEAEAAPHPRRSHLGERLLVLALFAAALTAAVLVVRGSGIVDSGSSAGSAAAAAPGQPVTSLEWPAGGLSLAATSEGIVWEQRSATPFVSGLWCYDPASGTSRRLVKRSLLGRTAGALVAFGSTVGWTARPRTASGDPEVRGYDLQTGRQFTASRHGTAPGGCDQALAWVDSSRRLGPAGTVVAGLDLVTDARFVVRTGVPVRRVVTNGRWTAWLGGQAVVVLDRRNGRRYAVGRRATAVALDGTAVVWASRLRDGRTAIAAWDLETRRPRRLYSVDSRVTDLVLSEQLVVWRQASNGGDVWALERLTGHVSAVCAAPSQQSAPVVAGRTVFWADRRNGGWQLYRRTL